MSHNCIHRFIDRTESTVILECTMCDATVEVMIPPRYHKCERLHETIALAIARDTPLPIPSYWTVKVAYDMPGHRPRDAASELATFLREEAFGDVQYEIEEHGVVRKIRGYELHDPDALVPRRLHSVE